jgi:hypothetical protein
MANATLEHGAVEHGLPGAYKDALWSLSLTTMRNAAGKT